MIEQNHILVINSLNRNHLASQIKKKKLAQKTIKGYHNRNFYSTGKATEQQNNNSVQKYKQQRKHYHSNAIPQLEQKNTNNFVQQDKGDNANISKSEKSTNKVRMRYNDLYRQTIESYAKKYNTIGPIARQIQYKQKCHAVYDNLITIQQIKLPEELFFRSTTNIYKSRKNSAKQKSYRKQKPHKKSFQNANQSSQCMNSKNFSQKSKSMDRNKTVDLFHRAKFSFQFDVKSQEILPINFTVQPRKPSKRQYFLFGMRDNKSSNENKLQNYRDFLWKVNFSNGLYVETPETCKGYKIYIGFGNNSQIIRTLMKRRFWWTIVDALEPSVNLIWTQLKMDALYSRQQKCKEQLNLMQYSIQELNWESCELDILKGIRKIYGKKDINIWLKYLYKNNKYQSKITDQTYIKRIALYQRKNMNKIADSSQLLMHNHFSENYYIGNKKALFYNLSTYCALKKIDPFKIIPKTFHISKGVDDEEYHEFLKQYQKIQKLRKNSKFLRNVWIVKPGENTNRGSGISVCYGIEDIKQRLKGRQRNKNGDLRTFIVQKYIQNPLCYYRRKFDIRHYMLITCIQGRYKGYWFDQGYIRTSSNQFNLRNTKDPLTHLTNDAIQQHGQNFGKYQKGNKVSYADFSKYLNKNHPKAQKYDNYFQQIILPTLKQYSIQAIRSTFPLLDNQRRKHNFQIFGMDFMIDDDLKPWLIEINTNPCLQTPCPLLQRLIPSLIQNILRICIDPLFPPPQNWPYNKKLYMGENTILENRFQLIFDEIDEGHGLKKLFGEFPRIDKKMGQVKQDEDVYENDGKIDIDEPFQ